MKAEASKTLEKRAQNGYRTYSISANKKTSPVSRGGEIDSIFWWKLRQKGPWNPNSSLCGGGVGGRICCIKDLSYSTTRKNSIQFKACCHLVRSRDPENGVHPELQERMTLSPNSILEAPEQWPLNLELSWTFQFFKWKPSLSWLSQF